MFHTTPEDVLCDRGGKSRQNRNNKSGKREEECYESETQQTFPPYSGSIDGRNDDGLHVWNDGVRRRRIWKG